MAGLFILLAPASIGYKTVVPYYGTTATPMAPGTLLAPGPTADTLFYVLFAEDNSTCVV